MNSCNITRPYPKLKLSKGISPKSKGLLSLFTVVSSPQYAGFKMILQFYSNIQMARHSNDNPVVFTSCFPFPWSGHLWRSFWKPGHMSGLPLTPWGLAGKYLLKIGRTVLKLRVSKLQPGRDQFWTIFPVSDSDAPYMEFIYLRLIRKL